MRPVTWLSIAMVILAGLAGCSPDQTPQPPSAQGFKALSAADLAQLAEAAKEDVAWRYTDDPDRMTDGTDHTACIRSKDEATISDENSNTHLTRTDFCIAHLSGGEVQIWLDAFHGDFNCPMPNGCLIKMRVDAGKPLTVWAAVNPRRPSRAIVQDAEAVWPKVIGGQRLLLEAPFELSGRQVTEFAVAGFDASRMNMKRSRANATDPSPSSASADNGVN